MSGVRAWLRARPWWIIGAFQGAAVGVVTAVQNAFHDRVLVAVAVGLVGALVTGIFSGLTNRWMARREPPELRALGRERRAVAEKAARSRRLPPDPEVRSDAVVVLRHRLDITRRVRTVAVAASGLFAAVLPLPPARRLAKLDPGS